MDYKAPSNLVLGLDIQSKVSEAHEMERCLSDENLIYDFYSASETGNEGHCITDVDQHGQVQVIHCHDLEEILFSHEECERHKQKSS